MLKYNDSFGYSGTINVQLRFKDKTVKSATYKNSGSFPMFYGIVSGLAGNFSQMSRYLPKYIKLYQTEDFTNPYNEDDILITPTPFFYTDTPAVKNYDTLSDINPAQVVFKFNISFSSLNLNQATKINKFCLCSDWNKDMKYTEDPDNSYDLFNAYFSIADDTKAIDIANIKDVANYSLYLEWTIKITNNGGTR